ncbi:MAG: hypothetical protein J5789_09055 [Oscillospiraceae bacterium]|nr:hypothetical protein [Oscillospiraceae bacterium]
MKWKQLLPVFAFLIAAALLGWFLPSVVFHIDDRLEADHTQEMQIRQFDLNYQSNLDTASRLRLMQSENGEPDAIPLERGIFLQEQDVEEICGQFLLDLTGYSIPELDHFYVMPILMNYPDEGTFLVWAVGGLVNDAWNCELLLDDQTGLILRCSFSGPAWSWTELLYDFNYGLPVQDYAASRFSQALCSHFNARLGSRLTAAVETEEENELFYRATLILSDGDREEFVIPFEILFEEGVFSIN